MFKKWRGMPMKLIFVARLIMIIFFIFMVGAAKYDASVLYPLKTDPKAYAEREPSLKSWMRLSGAQRKKLVGGYLRLTETSGLPEIPAAERARVEEILADVTPENLVAYINETCMFSKKALPATDSGIEAIIRQYVQNRLEMEKNHRELLEIAKMVSEVKDEGSDRNSGYKSNDTAEDSRGPQKISDTPKHFSFEGWQSLTRDEKLNLVTGYTAFLEILIKEDFCLNDEERRRFDLYCKLVTVNELVDHVDRLYQDPLYRDDGAQILIYNYMTYNFQNYIGDPLAYWG
jgi:hypothetical protein